MEYKFALNDIVDVRHRDKIVRGTVIAVREEDFMVQFENGSGVIIPNEASEYVSKIEDK